jgi:hypothetical protein
MWSCQVTIEVFPSDHIDPRQALLQADEELDEMESVAIVYFRRGEDVPRLTCSSMPPMELNFLGTALQHYSMRFMRE